MPIFTVDFYRFISTWSTTSTTKDEVEYALSIGTNCDNLE